MQIPILVEPVAGNGFRAVSAEPLAFSADGATSDEALTRVRALLNQRLSNGAKVVSFDVDVTHPLAEFAGMFKDDPYSDEVLEIIAENRRTMDADSNVP